MVASVSPSWTRRLAISAISSAARSLAIRFARAVIAPVISSAVIKYLKNFWYSICSGFNNWQGLSLHYLYKMEHFIGTLVVAFLVLVGLFYVRHKMLPPKLIDLKTAFIYVKM